MTVKHERYDSEEFAYSGCVVCDTSGNTLGWPCPTVRRARALAQRPRSWHAVADMLAARLVHHAVYECGHHDEPIPDECPFCADVAAYEAWRAYSMPRPIG